MSALEYLPEHPLGAVKTVDELKALVGTTIFLARPGRIAGGFPKDIMRVDDWSIKGRPSALAWEVEAFWMNCPETLERLFFDFANLGVIPAPPNSISIEDRFIFTNYWFAHAYITQCYKKLATYTHVQR